MLARIDDVGVGYVIDLGHLAIVQPIAERDGIQGVAALHLVYLDRRVAPAVLHGCPAAAAAAGEGQHQ
jgi:hypothetical protein